MQEGVRGTYWCVHAYVPIVVYQCLCVLGHACVCVLACLCVHISVCVGMHLWVRVYTCASVYIS